MVTGSVVAAIGAYLFLQGGARLLGADRFGAISALWTIQFLIMAVALVPIEQLTIRLRAQQSRSSVEQATTAVVALAALAAGGYAWVNVDALFAGQEIFVVLAVLSVVTMGIFAFGRGELAGRLRYRDYGLVTGGQSLLRLAAGLGLIALTDSAVGGGWAMVLTPLLVVAWWPGRQPEDGLPQPTAAAAFLTGVLVANAAAQIILVAGPLAVERLGGSAAEVSVLFVTLTLFRAPLAIANNLLARLLPPFSALAATGKTATLGRWALWLPLAGGLLALAAIFLGGWLGPGVTSGLFGSEFRPSAETAALVAGGSVLATVAAFANQILVALGATWRLAAAWIFGLIVAAVVMAVVTGDPAHRVAAGFLAGEVGALVAVAAAARTWRPTESTRSQ
ncbi:MAG: hypothetical protein OER12_02580 [Acidimicrobiia bacterium]|nr:hypothetical protein [Acidimicrobiia bacterium]